MKFKFLSIIISALIPSLYIAQDCDEIMGSDQYESALSQAESEDAARNTATEMLLKQFSAVVSSTSVMETRETDGSFSQDFMSRGKSVSNLRLSGLKYKTCKTGRRPDNKSVLAYISKQDLKKSADHVNDQVNRYVEMIEQKQVMGIPVIADVYSAYLYTFLTPFAVPGKVNGDSISNLQVFLESKLHSHINNLKIEPLRAELTIPGIDEQITVHLKINGAERGLNYSFYCPAYNAQASLSSQSSPFHVVMRPS